MYLKSMEYKETLGVHNGHKHVFSSINYLITNMANVMDEQ